MFEYKVLTERDTRLSGKFDLMTLETALNGYARDGWRLAEGFLAANLAKTAKAEIVLILERATDRATLAGTRHAVTPGIAPVSMPPAGHRA